MRAFSHRCEVEHLMTGFRSVETNKLLDIMPQVIYLRENVQWHPSATITCPQKLLYSRSNVNETIRCYENIRDSMTGAQFLNCLEVAGKHVNQDLEETLNYLTWEMDIVTRENVEMRQTRQDRINTIIKYCEVSSRILKADIGTRPTHSVLFVIGVKNIQKGSVKKES